MVLEGLSINDATHLRKCTIIKRGPITSNMCDIKCRWGLSYSRFSDSLKLNLLSRSLKNWPQFLFTSQFLLSAFSMKYHLTSWGCINWFSSRAIGSFIGNWMNKIFNDKWNVLYYDESVQEWCHVAWYWEKWI